LSSSEDELDTELRRLFGDERLTVLPREGADDAIVAGARRVRRRRTMLATAGGATTAVVLVAGVVVVSTLRGDGSAPSLAENSATRSASMISPTAAAPPVPGTSLPPSAGSTETRPPQNPPEPGAHQTTDPASTRSRTVSVVTGPQLGPSSYGSLRLGMLAEDFAKAGITLSGTPSGSGCETFGFSGGGVPGSGQVTFSGSNEVVRIVPSGPTHTPEKIGTGSAKDDVFAAYPGARQSAGSGLVAPAGSGGKYTFTLDGSGQKVQSIRLDNVSGDCG
jgi:hypothetical protein